MKQAVWIAFMVLFVFGLGAFPVVGKDLTAITVEWEPYYGPKLKNGGFFTHVSEEAFRRAGYDVTLQYVPWKRAVDKVKRGEKDILWGAYINDERKQWSVFSDIIAKAQTVLIALKKSNIQYKGSLDDLKLYKIGVQRGFATSPEFDKADFLKKEFANSLDSNISKLGLKRVDLVVDGRAVFFSRVNKKFPQYKTSFKALEPALAENGIYIAVSKKRPDAQKIIDGFNKAFAGMKADGSFDAILNDHGIQ